MIKQDFKPISVNALSPNTMGDHQYVFANRQSSENNAQGHERYEPLMAGAHSRLSLNEPFRLHGCTKSGSVRILHDAFNSDNMEAALAGSYFEWLINVLKSELKNAPGKKLCVVYPSIDRIFRPAGYKRNGGGTASWHYTEADYALFQRFLDYFLGERAADIVFAVLDNTPPVQNNGVQND